MPSWISSHPHAIHTLALLCPNWTSHQVPPLPKHPSLPARHLPLSRAPWVWNTTQSPGMPFPFPIKHSTRRRPRPNHGTKRDPRTALRSEFFGRSHSHGHSATHHHQHHGARHQHIRTVLHNRVDVSLFRPSRRNRHHKSTLRFYFTLSFRSSLFPISFRSKHTDVTYA